MDNELNFRQNGGKTLSVFGSGGGTERRAKRLLRQKKDTIECCTSHDITSIGGYSTSDYGFKEVPNSATAPPAQLKDY